MLRSSQVVETVSLVERWSEGLEETRVESLPDRLQCRRVCHEFGYRRFPVVSIALRGRDWKPLAGSRQCMVGLENSMPDRRDVVSGAARNSDNLPVNSSRTEGVIQR